MEKKDKFDYEALKRKTLEQLRSGKSLFRKDGAFTPLLKDILGAAMEGEIENHLDEEERSSGNRKQFLMRINDLQAFDMFCNVTKRTGQDSNPRSY